MNYVDCRNSIIVCSKNYKNQDENPIDDRLWPSEILWQSWAMEAQTQECSQSGLKAIVRFYVVNESTKTIIWKAMQSSTSTKEGPHFYREYTDLDDGYFAILGSPNGASTMRMLNDHKAAIGHRTVERVIVLGDENISIEEPQSRSFLLLLTS